MLTAEQIEARRGKLTASRIACLMRGEDARAEIHQLYLEMTGQAVEEDLSKVWPVQLGSATEGLNLNWYEMKNGVVLARRGEVALHPKLSWAAATLDGWDPALGCPIECKHVGGREPVEVVIDRYQPQMQWQCEVTGAKHCGLSIILGANEPIVEFIPRDEPYIAEMTKRGEQFMRCVAERRPPVALDPVPPPIDPTRHYDMSGNNAWGNSAAAWLTDKPAHDRARDAEKILKAIVPEDAKRCFGHGVQITRDRAGRLSLRSIT